MKKSISFLFCSFLVGCGGASFTEKVSPQMHLITTTSSESGNIEPSSMSIENGGSGKFMLVASDGYAVEEVKGCQGTLSENTYTVSNVSSSCTIEVDFSLNNTSLEPTAEILFPWKVSNNSASKITVRGIAASIDGIASISVNGIDATLKPISNRTQFSKVENTASANNNTKADSYSWQAVVNLSNSRDTELVVKATTNSGNVNNKAATATVERKIVPDVFTVDLINRRLLGRKAFDYLISYELDTVSTPVVIPIFSLTGEYISGGFNDLAYSLQNDAAIFSSVLQGVLNIYSVDVSTGELTTLSNYDLGLDSDEWLFAAVNNFSYDNIEDVLYLSLAYFSAKSYELNKAVVYKYDFVNDAMNIINDNLLVFGSSAVNSRVEFTESGLLFTDSGQLSGIKTHNSISLLSLNGEQISPVANLPSFQVYSLDSNRDNTFAYAAGSKGIAKVDLNLGQYQVLSPDEEETELNFAQLRSVSLDENNNRLLVSDSGLDMVMQVDLTTGVRSEFLSNGVGTGRRMITPREIAIGNESNTIYVADDGDNTAGAILAIDLATGNRRVILELNNTESHSLADIVVDDSKQLLYILFEQELIKVDIATNSRTTISSNHFGEGEPVSSLSGAALDSENNRILVTDGSNSTLLSIDLTTGERIKIASGFGNSGDGDFSAVDVEYDPLDKKALVLSQSFGALYSVDLNSGNKEVVLESCLTSNNEEGLVANDWTLQNMFFEPSSRKLLITAQDTLLQYDIDNSTCTAPAKNWSVYGVFDIVSTPKGQVLASEFNLLKQIDLEGSEQVVISK